VPLRTVLRCLAAGVCVAGVVASLITYRSETRLEDGFLSLVVHEPRADALELLDGSAALNPDARRSLGRAILLERAGRGTEAVEELSEAARREPENASVWLTWSRIEIGQGDRDAASRLYARARELDSQLPRQPLPP
jgi:hypothetical protein